MANNYFFSLMIALIFLALACTPQQQSEQFNTKADVPEVKEKVVEKIAVEQPKGNPTLNIFSPKDGELIKSSKVIVELKEENFNIVPIGSPVKYGEGHFHAWFDSEKKVTTNKTIAFENIVSGKHTIVAELVNSDHSSLNPRLTKLITINVESGYMPKVEQPQQDRSEERRVGKECRSRWSPYH